MLNAAQHLPSLLDHHHLLSSCKRTPIANQIMQIPFQTVLFFIFGLLFSSPSNVKGAPTINDGKTGTNLISTNFRQTTSTGMWLVEFFSPWCHHCQAFAPTWSMLVEMNEHLADSSDFHFGRVDCMAQGDVCTSNSIRGYPTVRLMLDGKKVQDYSGDRTYEELSTFILTNAKEHREHLAATKQA